MSFPFFFSFFFPNVDVRCQTVVLAENEKKKKNFWGMEEEKKVHRRRKSARKKTAFDRVLLESKPRDTFESLEMHLFFFFRERERRKRKMSPNHTPPKNLCIIIRVIILSSDVNTQSVK